MSASPPLNISYHSPSRSPSSGLYVPLHKRTSSRTSTSSSPSSSTSSSQRSTSPTPHLSDTFSYSDSCRPSSLPIYTPDQLIAISSSPLAKLSPEGRMSLRDVAPHIVMSRKQRKSLEWNAREKGAQTPSLAMPSARSGAEPRDAGRDKYRSMENWGRGGVSAVNTI
ncbi:hypothetical protein SERLA73DRAFT_175684 [Serpula lacrymans var. lacrymans S7.3]|uniref:Uncharacterized protein n=2 Tax=Serpula lacrymans var. lacrymans TaxID=341189 RepID=F8PL66_SERL3|nr:uncharacterized protein SERLADRAFT_458239 [Serpula lacrymans var. lacrymans S7.9]EGO03974.1 hypothetical protein SERLA73DRAFT_175684 [Serpula lacrymans var. lacrymans S7.3]EGO29893.1 hypothetical protein SERLADRAFT_458239 [Serpula lacrymans var. lacrymans S7.9]